MKKPLFFALVFMLASFSPYTGEVQEVTREVVISHQYEIMPRYEVPRLSEKVSVESIAISDVFEFKDMHPQKPEPSSMIEAEETDCYFEPVIENVFYWRPMVNEFMSTYPYLNKNILHLDNPEFLALAIIAQESNGERFAVSQDGHATKGLMQIMDRWADGDLFNPRINISTGMWLLDRSIKRYSDMEDYKPAYDNEIWPEELYFGIAAYNCGFTSTDNGECLWFGGPAYTDKILTCWIPAFMMYEEQH